MSNKKILFITSTQLYWGSEKSLTLLAKSIIESFDIHILTVDGPLVTDLNKYNIPYGLFTNVTLTKLTFLSFLKLSYRLSRFIKKNEFDIIHANDLISSQYSILASKTANIKSVAHIRDPYLSRTLKRNNITILKMADRIIAVSKSVKKELVEAGIIDKKISVVYDAVELSEKDNSNRSRLKIRKKLLGYSEDNLIGICGRIVPIKGHIYLFKALPDILKRFKSTRILVVGEAPYDGKYYLKKIKKAALDLGVNNYITFLGFRDDIQLLMKCLDILVVPSIAEPFGMVVIEAMAAKTPVVASSVGGMLEIIDDKETGLLVPPKDPSQIATAILNLLSNKTYTMFIVNNAEKKVKKLFSVKVQKSKIQKIYNELLV